ncbi:GNAT family N-acetyltransferase [Wenxinia marina]|uniref:Uncharacterized protein involved in methicillin resistance n=1 Tax=Wenxinia marina DSM 24838 TaxID=1123501 RepID=A0A0D0QCU2_9RHOB|nr:GNAT family N-acetyltransferase [Wenxinia marina]KIQ68783.1 Uncharacterized protein involved in methicillin resistance [Wenxinia marina DSM 24838]GGL65213.1 hypothetical protein GCM10011392_19890 [Wenxinia marina]
MDPPSPDAPPLQQHSGYAAALARLGRRAETVRTGGAAMLVLRRGPLTLTARGPLWDSALDLAARTLWLRRHGPRLVEAEADDAPALAAAGYGRVLTSAAVADLDLTGGPQAIWARARGKWRNRALVGRRAALRLRNAPFDGDPDHWLLSAEARMRSERAYRALPLALTVAFAAANPGAARLFVMERGTQPLAGMLFFRHGRAVTYMTGWTGPEGRAVSAHHLILMRAAAWYGARGAVRMDLGSVDTEAAPGLARFKLGSGARLRRLGGSWLRLRW